MNIQDIQEINNLNGSNNKVSGDDKPWINLTELVIGKVYVVQRLFKVEGKYGQHGVAELSNCLVSLPKHCTKMVDAFLDEKWKEELERGDIGFTVREYTNEYGTFRTVDFNLLT